MIEVVVSIDAETGKDKRSVVFFVPHLGEIEVGVGVLVIGTKRFVADDHFPL